MLLLAVHMIRVRVRDMTKVRVRVMAWDRAKMSVSLGSNLGSC